MIDDLRSGRLLQIKDISKGNQAVGVRAHIVLPQIASVHTEWLIGLHVNAIRAVIEVEVIDVLRTHVHAERLRNLADRHSNGFCLLTIDLHKSLRIVGGKAGKQSDEIVALPAPRHDLVRDVVDILQSVAT